MRESKIETVERYLDALRSKDLSRAPLAPDIVFIDPLTPERTGAEEWRAFIEPILPAFKEVRVLRHIVEGDYVATMWEADMVWGVIPVFELFRVEDGRIKEARAFWDPRPINAVA
jgi:limonene-1,2-epoxide hydrolase